MIKVTMPEPSFRAYEGNELKGFITTDQAEAYKDACVREALEAVIQSLEKESGKARNFQAYAAVLALMSQAELIRVSLSAKESKNG